MLFPFCQYPSVCYADQVKQLFQTLYQDDQILAINKPPRMASVPSEGIPMQDTVLGMVQQQFADKGFKPFLLHRLDFETSGILLFGKNEADREKLEGIFKQPDTHKKYIALLKGVPTGRSITKKLPARESPEEIFAKTEYKIITVIKGRHVPNCALIEAEIKTGRRHQIRKHFSSVGHPVILDRRYGDQQFNRKFRLRFRLGRQFLHAARIVFRHPFSEKLICIDAPLPMDLQSTLKRLHFGQ